MSVLQDQALYRCIFLTFIFIFHPFICKDLFVQFKIQPALTSGDETKFTSVFHIIIYTQVHFSMYNLFYVDTQRTAYDGKENKKLHSKSLVIWNWVFGKLSQKWSHLL